MVDDRRNGPPPFDSPFENEDTKQRVYGAVLHAREPMTAAEIADKADCSEESDTSVLLRRPRDRHPSRGTASQIRAQRRLLRVATSQRTGVEQLRRRVANSRLRADWPDRGISRWIWCRLTVRDRRPRIRPRTNRRHLRRSRWLGHRYRGTPSPRASAKKVRQFYGTITQLTMAPIDDGATPAPIDRSVLEQIRSQFTGSRMVESAEIVAEDNLYLHVDFSDDYYPERCLRVLRSAGTETRISIFIIRRPTKTIRGNVDGIGTRTHITNGHTFIHHRLPVASNLKTLSGQTITETSVRSSLNTSESVSRHCGMRDSKWLRSLSRQWQSQNSRIRSGSGAPMSTRSQSCFTLRPLPVGVLHQPG